MQIERRLNELHNRKRRDDYAITELQQSVSVSKKSVHDLTSKLAMESKLLAEYRLVAETSE